MSTSWPTPTPRRSSTRLPGHRGPRRAVLRLRRGARSVRPRDLAVRRCRGGRLGRPAATRRRTPRRPRQGWGWEWRRVAQGGSRDRALGVARLRWRVDQQQAEAGRDAAGPTLRLPDPEAALLALHPRDGAGGLRHLPGAVRAGRTSAHQQQRAGADLRVLLRRGVDAAQRGRQMIRTASILQSLLGNIGRPGGGIMALRGHASIQARPTSRRCSTSFRATCPCPTLLSTSTWRPMSRTTRARRASGAT